MSFPSEFPKQALGKIFAVVKGEKADVDQLALAAYELVGYALHLGFGDVKYAAGISPEILKLVNDVIAGLDIKALRGFPVAELVSFVVGEFARGTRPALIAVKVLFKFGPKAFSVVSTILEAFKKVS